MVILYGVVSSGETTLCRMTGVTLHGVVSSEKLRGADNLGVGVSHAGRLGLASRVVGGG